MKKVLSKGDITVSRTFLEGYGQGMVTIKDAETGSWLCIYPEEAAYLAEALKEILQPVSHDPQSDQF